MLFLALGLALTGYLMARGQKETFEDIHELLANGFLVVVLMHVAGVVLHAFRHQDGIAFSMVDGAKCDVPSGETISGSRPVTAMLFMGLVATFSLYLANNFDSQTRTMNLFGTQLRLGENEEDEGAEQGQSREEGEENGENGKNDSD